MAHDAIVIGSGASGAIAAWALTVRGLRVLMLEAGRQVTQADFDPARKPRNPKPINVTERAIATLMGQKIQSRAAFFRGMLRHFYVSDRDDPYTTDRDAPFVWIRGCQTGDRTHTFGRGLMRWNDDDFQRGAVAWPFDYAELAPFYDEVESLLGVYGNADGPNRPLKKSWVRNGFPSSRFWTGRLGRPRLGNSGFQPDRCVTR